MPERTATTSAAAVLGERPLSTLDGQYVLDHDQLDLFAPFERGVDLRAPRPRLWIAPGKVAGEPHLAISSTGASTFPRARVFGYRSVVGQNVQRVAPPGSIVETDVAERGVMR